MAFIVKNTSAGNFEPCPEGEHRVVCCEVEDLGEVETQFGLKHKVLFKFQTDTKMEDGRPYMLFQRFNVSMNEKASMRKFLEKWRGAKYNEQQLRSEGFDIEKMVGVNGDVYVTHDEVDGKVYSNINVIKPPKDGKWMALKVVANDAPAEKEEPKKETITPDDVAKTFGGDVVAATDAAPF